LNTKKTIELRKDFKKNYLFVKQILPLEGKLALKKLKYFTTFCQRRNKDL